MIGKFLDKESRFGADKLHEWRLALEWGGAVLVLCWCEFGIKG